MQDEASLYLGLELCPNGMHPASHADFKLKFSKAR